MASGTNGRASWLLCLTLLIALTTATTLFAAGNPGQARPASIKAAPLPETVEVNTAVTMVGRVKPRLSRSVKLQIRKSGKWKTADRTHSSRRGKFALTFTPRAPGTYSLRARAPKRKNLESAKSAAQSVAVTPSGTPGGGDHSFQALYLLPSGKSPVPDEPAAISNVISQVNSWFDSQTVDGTHPRFSLDSAGRPTVVTVAMPHTSAEYEASSNQIKMIVDDLRSIGWPQSENQKLVAFINVNSNDGGCGITGYGLSLFPEDVCGIHPSTSDTFPYGATYVTAHEITHNLGAVADCATHGDGTGHVNDDPRDVLYNGPQPRDWNHITLDPGHDDYYATGRTDCTDIANSPYWSH